MIRVRLSLPQLTSVVGENGSRVRVIDSTASARVEVCSLINVGRPVCALEFLKSGNCVMPTSAQTRITITPRQRLVNNLFVIRTAMRRCNNLMGKLRESITNQTCREDFFQIAHKRVVSCFARFSLRLGAFA
jgi:hypothetical protein